LTSTHIVVTAGLAETATGSIAMGLGGYLAARNDVEHFLNERRREEQEIVENAEVEKQEMVDLFHRYGVTPQECAPIVTALERKPEAWRDFMMRFELGLEEPNPKRAVRSAIAIGTSYVVGGLVPLAPYMLIRDSGSALGVSAAITLLALAVFGFVKSHFTGVSKIKGAVLGGAHVRLASAGALTNQVQPLYRRRSQLGGACRNWRGRCGRRGHRRPDRVGDAQTRSRAP
jgi:vacuolar iron transporter family protein